MKIKKQIKKNYKNKKVRKVFNRTCISNMMLPIYIYIYIYMFIYVYVCVCVCVCVRERERITDWKNPTKCKKKKCIRGKEDKTEHKQTVSIDISSLFMQKLHQNVAEYITVGKRER